MKIGCVLANGDMFVDIDIKFNELFDVYKSITPVLQDFLLKTAQNLLDAQRNL